MNKIKHRNCSISLSGRKTYSCLLIIITFIFLASCGHYIAPYNETAYQNATDLKVESLAVMSKATEPYADNAQEVEGLMIKVDQAYEFSKGIPKNDLATKQWKIMIDPEGNMLGGFIKQWENSGQLNTIFVDEMKGQVSQGFDQIIDLESAKIKD